MGCFFEFLADIFLETVGYAYIELMSLIVPKHKLSHKADRTLRTVVSAFTLVLFFAIITGIGFMFSTNQDLKNVGYYLIFIPLGITVVQVVAGIIIRIKSKKK